MRFSISNVTKCAWVLALLVVSTPGVEGQQNDWESDSNEDYDVVYEHAAKHVNEQFRFDDPWADGGPNFPQCKQSGSILALTSGAYILIFIAVMVMIGALLSCVDHRIQMAAKVAELAALNVQIDEN
eukprot:51608_1